LPELEDQLCSYTGAAGESSPDRLDALVWGLSELFGVQPGDAAVWGASGPQWGVAA
jgi:phage terminase large subunit-like protein